MKWINILEGIRILEREDGFERKFSSVVRTAVFTVSLFKTFPLGKHELENGKLQENTLRVRYPMQSSGNPLVFSSTSIRKLSVYEEFGEKEGTRNLCCHSFFHRTPQYRRGEKRKYISRDEQVLVYSSNFGRTKLQIVCFRTGFQKSAKVATAARGNIENRGKLAGGKSTDRESINVGKRERFSFHRYILLHP